jgi:hypothetical protein
MTVTTPTSGAKASAPPPQEDRPELPWGYGDNRITAMVRDPDSVYLYWEITDDGIADARRRLGPAGAQGGCNLRIYDTTGRDFDGTNANDYFDIGVDRGDREYFLMIRRPSSSMHAEIGIKTHEGYFQPIARSGRADFPRNAPSPSTHLEWMTVFAEGAPPCVSPYLSRYAGPEPRLPGREGAGYVDVWRAGYAPSMAQEAAPVREHGSWSGTHRTLERRVEIERWWHLDEWRAEWRAGMRFVRWEEFDPERFAVELLGETPVRVHVEGGEMTVYGPWRVTIRGFEKEPQRRVLGTWSVRWVRATTPMIERWERVVERRRVASWEREHAFTGASEQQMLVERGASELVRVGGSERMWLGASEWMAGGASETMFLGASQLGFLGASIFRGASEQVGASEAMGASEANRAVGASEQASRYATGERWAGRPEEK